MILLSIYFLAVHSYKCIRLTTSIYGIITLKLYLSVTGGQWKRFDTKSVHQAFEARLRQSLWTTVIALTTGTNTSFLDRLYKIGNNVHLHGVAWAAWFTGGYCHSHRHEGSRFCFWHFAFTRLAGEMASELTNFLASWLIRIRIRIRIRSHAMW